MAVKKRCIRCRQYTREDGTCQNPECVRFTPANSSMDDSEIVTDVKTENGDKLREEK